MRRWKRHPTRATVRISFASDQTGRKWKLTEAMVVVRMADPPELMVVTRPPAPPLAEPDEEETKVVRVAEPAELVKVVSLPPAEASEPVRVVVLVADPAELVRVVTRPAAPPEPERVVVNRPAELLPVLTTTVSVPEALVTVAVEVALDMEERIEAQMESPNPVTVLLSEAGQASSMQSRTPNLKSCLPQRQATSVSDLQPRVVA